MLLKNKVSGCCNLCSEVFSDRIAFGNILLAAKQNINSLRCIAADVEQVNKEIPYLWSIRWCFIALYRALSPKASALRLRIVISLRIN